MQQSLTGPLAALVTPMGPSGDLDLGALVAHVGFQRDHGVPAVVVGGSIGEAVSLTLEERRALTGAAVTAAAGGVQVIVSVTHDHVDSSLALMDHAAAQGADGLLVSIPPFYKLTPAEQLGFWERVAAHALLPIVAYCSGHGASQRPAVEELEPVVALEPVIAVKEASPDVERLQALVDRFQPEVPVIAAGEKTLPEGAATGVAAAMTASICFAPGRVRTVLERAQAGDVEGSREAFGPIASFRAAFQPAMDAGYPSYIPYTKAACDLVGLPSGPPRTPLAPVDAMERERVRPAVLAAR